MVIKVKVWKIKATAYNSSQYLQSSEAHIWRYVRWGVINKQRDCDKAEVNQEREDVKHEQPLEEYEIGEDTGAKLATDLFHDALP